MLASRVATLFSRPVVTGLSLAAVLLVTACSSTNTAAPSAAETGVSSFSVQ